MVGWLLVIRGWPICLKKSIQRWDLTLPNNIYKYILYGNIFIYVCVYWRGHVVSFRNRAELAGSRSDFAVLCTLWPGHQQPSFH